MTNKNYPIMSRNYVTQSCCAFMSRDYVAQLYRAIMSCNYVTQLCRTITSSNYLSNFDYYSRLKFVTKMSNKL